MTEPSSLETTMPNANESQDTPSKAPESSVPTAKKAGEGFDEFIKTIFGAFLIAFVVRMFIFEPFNIPSTSMVPGLLVGDYLFVSKYSYGYSSLSATFGMLPIRGKIFAQEPERGDVAVFKLPSDPRTDYIKRIVGLPGDSIQVRNGLLFINGVPVERQKLDEPIEQKHLKPHPEAVDYVESFSNGNKHIIREDSDDYPLDNTPVFVVPPDHFFAMGDNRDNSRDSRTSLVKFVPADHLVGRAEIIFFSMSENMRFWEFWKWPFEVRWDRFMKRIK